MSVNPEELHSLLTDRMTLDEHMERMKAARARAQWELGDPSWADVILLAYMEPAENMQDLEMEGGP